jgi:tetratricopeptide (TPR) repeat protein
MVEFDRTPDMKPDEISRVQVLRISWDSEAKRWFYLRPPDVDDKLAADDPLHWTGIAQRWQTMCADCHSTDLKRNFDPQSNRYHTTFSEIDVSCESCHGPGSLHVELANERSLFWDRRHGLGLTKLKGDDPEPQLQSCAPCHSRRGILDSNFKPGDPYCDHFQLESLQDDTYFADGQIKDEVYEYGSFLQSRMYHKGIRCSDCHDPHSLKLKHPGNETCTSCHQHPAGKYDVPSHHHHAPGTAGAQCVNCHMPHRTYMDVDRRRDHSLRVPRPDLSVSLGTPNACSSCHVADQLASLEESKRGGLVEYADWLEAVAKGDEQISAAVRKTDQWCDEACAERKKPKHYAETIASFRRGESGAVEQMLRLAMQDNETAPYIARASALNELAMAGAAETQAAETHETAAAILEKADEHPMVRAAAINLFMTAPPAAARKALMPLIRDESKLVRTEAARVLIASGAYASLSENERSRVSLAVREVEDALMSASDRAGSHMGWAILCEGQRRFDEAIKAYETAMRVEPGMTGPRSNLAALLEGLASQQAANPQAADDAVSMIQRAEELRTEELVLLERDAGLAPENAHLQYRLGLAFYLAGRMDDALQRLQKAVELAPGVADYRQALDLLRQKLGTPP